MRTSSHLLINFLLNAAWQIPLIAALASLGAWLLRSSAARYRHWLWVSALCLAFIVPATTSIRAYFETAAPLIDQPVFISEAVQLGTLEQPANTTRDLLPSVIQLKTELALILIGLYGVFGLYRSFRLVQAWQTTRNIKRNALELEPDNKIAAIINQCESDLDLSSRRIRVLRSETLPVPVTMGLAQPVVVLPDTLLREGNIELLTSAIGHEFIHVARNDYVLNFLYELIYLPLSFHPAAALLRRRIKQTRELCCDELVADRILNAEVYARSLLRLAGSAPALRQLSVTTTVGIADADILEARIMSLLTKPKMTPRWKRTLLFVVSILLLLPCVAAAAAFNMRFDLEAVPVQDPVQEELREKRQETELDKEKREIHARFESLKAAAAKIDAQKERLANDPEFQKQLERRKEIDLEMTALKAKAAQLDQQKERVPREEHPGAIEEMKRRSALEMEMRDVMHAELLRLAKISMEDAIKVATSHKPGKVLTASLGAKGWEAPGKLSKDGVVFYHILVANEADGSTTDVWVNAIDGTLLGSEFTLPRKRRSPENQ